MKKVMKFGVGLSLLATLVACSNETETTGLTESVETEQVDVKADTVLADEEYGKFIGFDQEGIKGEHKTMLELDMLEVMRDGINTSVLDSTTDTFYIFSDNDLWTETLMMGVRNNNADGEMDDVIKGYNGLVEVIPTNYNVVISNPKNTNNALMYYENGELVYSVFDE